MTIPPLINQYPSSRCLFHKFLVSSLEEFSVLNEYNFAYVTYHFEFC